MNQLPRRRVPPHARIEAKWIGMACWRSLSGNEAKLLVELLAQYRPDQPNCFELSNSEVARRLRCSRRTANRVVDRLAKIGWIRVERHGGVRGKQRVRSRMVSLSLYHTDTGKPAERNRFESWTPSKPSQTI